jgi:hypothetical protein
MAKITTREIKNQMLFFTKPEKKAPKIIPKKIADHLRRPISRTVHSFFSEKFHEITPFYYPLRIQKNSKKIFTLSKEVIYEQGLSLRYPFRIGQKECDTN